MKRFLLLCWLCACAPGSARGGATFQWVEADVSLRPDFKATVMYSVCLRAEGNLHGFYFQGAEEQVIFDEANARAFFNNNQDSLPIEIKPMRGNKWDIILADGRAIDSGDVIYRFTYATDFAQSGHAGVTKSEFGELVYFNWAPVQWDSPLQHYSVRVYYPVHVTAEQFTLEEMNQFGFRTEKFMNKEYLISYYGQPFNNQRWLTVRLHKDKIPAHYHFRVQQYIDRGYFGELPASVPA
ncbi:MAG: hypothetical protein JXB04_01125, partial [Kiritimatiellae bacterium]|nr:hypothetical protein [Kiritimatiellia bacterium]